MKAFAQNNDILLVLEKGEELITSLNKYAKENNLKGGWVNIIGGSSNLTIGFRDPELKEYLWKEFNEPLEIIGLQGNLAYINHEPIWHIHGTFSRKDYSVIGGHVKECTIGLTAEIYLQPNQTQLKRELDPDTGLNLIVG